MAIERTLAIIKPNAIQNGHVGEIITAIEREGFAIKGLKRAQLTKEILAGFYCEHVNKGFYPELEAFMLECPVVLMALEGENAVLRWRECMGATNPANAAEGSLRKKFGENVGRNATHGSDSVASGEREVGYFFSAFELA